MIMCFKPNLIKFLVFLITVNPSHDRCHLKMISMKIFLLKRIEVFMSIILNDTMKIASVYEAFQKTFPFLKLEFYEKRNGVHGNKKFDQDEQRVLKEFKYENANGKLITISPDTTVAFLEKAVSNYYMLTLQVFRKSGNVWLETTVTDNWTLEEQNKQGEAITAQMNRAKK